MGSEQLPAVARLAPSPTGAQHLGNARTYLIAYWSARAVNASLILRIEDIDSPRIKPWATEQAMVDLKWLGIEWDEGPDVGGAHGPYVQTQRTHLYQTALENLMAAGRVYPCVCSRRDIETAASAPHAGDEGPVYPGTCANWQLGDPLPEPGSFCWRFRCRTEQMDFVDHFVGTQSCMPSRDLGDFPVTRKTGDAAYQLAVVVDDSSMGVTEVVRGMDLLPSTFRQLELYRALGCQPPTFSHVPLVVGKDGRRLAKRHGDTRLSQYRESQIRPIDVVRWAAQSAGLFSDAMAQTSDLTGLHQEIIRAFRWDVLSRETVIVDPGSISLRI